MARVIRSPADLAALSTLFGELKLPITVSWVQGADRTTQQNALQWKWATEAAMQLNDRLPADLQAEWKLEIGVPIMRAVDDSFRELYDAVIRPQSYETKIKLMKQGYPVTSKMKVRPMVRYLDEVQRKCLSMGLHLTEPEDDLSKYHARHREMADA